MTAGLRKKEPTPTDRLGSTRLLALSIRCSQISGCQCPLGRVGRSQLKIINVIEGCEVLSGGNWPFF